MIPRRRPRAKRARGEAARVPVRVLVLGIGNPLRGDDGLGPRLVRALAGAMPRGCEARCRHGDLLGLLDDCGGFDALVCVDAAAPAGTPGRVHRFDLANGSLPRNLLPASSHGIGLAEALELARALGVLPPHVVVHAIEGGGFANGLGVDPLVAAHSRRVARRLRCEIRRPSRRAGPPRMSSRTADDAPRRVGAVGGGMLQGSQKIDCS